MYYEIKQGQVTVQRSQKKKKRVSSKTYFTSFFSFLLHSTSKVRMTEGTFCHVGVQFCFLVYSTLVLIISAMAQQSLSLVDVLLLFDLPSFQDCFSSHEMINQ